MKIIGKCCKITFCPNTEHATETYYIDGITGCYLLSRKLADCRQSANLSQYLGLTISVNGDVDEITLTFDSEPVIV